VINSGAAAVATYQGENSMATKSKKPSSWVGLEGRWDLDAGSPKYLGPTEGSSFPFGVAVCDLYARAGKISVSIKLDKEKGLDSSGRAIFGYSPISRNYYSAGINAYTRAYAVDEYLNTRGWKAVSFTGDYRNLNLGKVHQVDVEFKGQVANLVVDQVRVIQCNLTSPLESGQTGLFAWGDSPVIFNNYTVSYEIMPTAFVVMQFGEPYDGIYKDVIKPVAKEVGLEAYRADDVFRPGIVLQDIIQGIAEAEVIIADITPPNQNVFYELGYSHGLGKTTILLAERGSTLPFDVSGFRVIFYDNSISGKPRVEESLRKHLASIIEE
jgi:hypothetical protein